MLWKCAVRMQWELTTSSVTFPESDLIRSLGESMAGGRGVGGRDDRLRVLMLTAFPAIGGPLPKLAPLVAEGLSRCGCDVAVAGWSAHSAEKEAIGRKVTERT